MPEKGRALLLAMQQRSNSEKADGAETFAVCDAGIPLGWLFLFGGRNFWAPDDHVADRGGTMAERNRFETPTEVAEARLENAIGALRATPTLWPWLASVELLHRRLIARGSKGFLRLDANWAFCDEPTREKLFSLLAYAENIVNLAAATRLQGIPPLAEAIEEFAPFAPRGLADDASRFARAKGHADLQGARRAAALAVGLPERGADRFLALVDSECAEAYDTLGSITYPAPPAAPKPEGLMGRMRAIFGKK